MRRTGSLLIAALFSFTTACGGSDDNSSPSSGGSAGIGGAAGSGGASGGAGTAGSAGTAGTPPWQEIYAVDLTLPSESTPPFDVGALNVKFYKDVPYGSDPRTVFDITVPESATPTPLLIHIHGGGFVGGSKDGTYGDNGPELKSLLEQGVAYASVEYRVLDDGDPIGVIKPLTDSKRALQFIRYHAADFNIDPSKITLEGGSAGAGTSLWLAFHDDMAEPNSSDPVSQQSTRVLGAAANSTQATYDLKKWDSVVFVEYGVSFLDAAIQQGLGPRLFAFYGISSVEELDSPKIQAYRADVDMLALMSPDDPPFYVHNPLTPAIIPANENLLFHHAYHARALTEQADSIGLSYIAYIEALNVADPSGKTDWDYAIDQLSK